MTSTHFLNRIMGNVFHTQTSPGLPSKVYLGLSSTLPNASGSNVTEPSSSAGYKRIELTSLSAPTNGAITNRSDIVFPESTASWGTVKYFVLYDALTSGNLLMFGTLSQSRNVEVATIVMVKTGSLRIALTD